MRIRQIHIDGFGRFSGVEYGPLEGPVTVFHGPNEAGKSTLLEFVRRVLYGFPDGRSKTNLYPPLIGGNHGGRLTVEDSEGRRYDIRRTPGSRGGAVTITASTGQPQVEAALPRLLGHNSRDVFEQIFGFTLNELYSDKLLSDSNVNNQIYSAGMGVTSLPNAIRSIQSEREALFRMGGRSNQKTYVLSGEIEEVDGRLQEVEDNATMYGELTSRLQQVESELEELAAQRRRIQSRHNRQVTLQNAWDAWNDSVSAEQELTTLPGIDSFPADGVNRLEALEERVRNTRREYESARRRLAEAERAADMRVEHEAVLNHSSDIRRLQNGRTAFDDFVRDLPEREAELEGHKKTLADTLKVLGPDWDEARLEEFDLSIAVRQEITQHGDRLRDASAEHSNRIATLDQDTTALEEAKDAACRTQLEFQAAVKPDLNAEQILQRRTLIRTALTQLGAVDRARQNLSNLESQLEGVLGSSVPVPDQRGMGKVGAPVIALAVFVLIAAGVVVPAFAFAVIGPMESIVLTGLLVGLALLGIAAYRLISGRMSGNQLLQSPLAASIRHLILQAEQELSAIESQFNETAGHLGIDEITEHTLTTAEGSLDTEVSKLAEWDALSRTLREARELVDQRKARKALSEKAVEQASNNLKSTNSEWQQWLSNRGLMNTFKPETAEVLQGQVDLGRNRLGEVRSWQQRVKGIQRRIDEYIEAVEPLATTFDVTFDRNDSRTVAAAADSLVELLESVQESVRKRDGAEVELEEAELQLEERKNDLEKAEEELGQLLQSGGAEDAEEFRVRAELSARRTSLEVKALSAHNRLQRLSGPGEALERLRADLTDTDPQSIDDAIAALEDERDNADAQISERDTERGAMQREVKALVGEEESSRLRMERHVLQEQIKGHAHDWARLTLAQNLLEEARRKFERERQPGVVRHAEKFFTQITDGRYRQVYAPLGEQTITVTDADGQTKQPSELSRGTREQLFLSLRFGLIRELGQRTEPLPVVVDEVLVNFDPERALRAAFAFTELSHTNQVLVFTCHPTVVELFRDAASEAGIEEPAIVQIS